MSDFILKGLGVALVTPFDESNNVDFDALGRIIDSQAEADVDFLTVLGTTAETPTLTLDERNEIREFVVRRVNGRMPLMLGLGGNNTYGVIDELSAADLNGYSSILSVVPYYNKPTQQGIYEHYSMIAKHCPLPLVLYNVPGRTGVNMKADTCLRLARENQNIIGVKEASADIEQISEILQGKPSGFNVISGDDGLTLTLMKIGASGVISVAANALPSEMKQLVDLCIANDYHKAEELNCRLREFFNYLFTDGNPAGIKCALSIQNKIVDKLRLPLVKAGDATRSAIKEIINNFQK